ncbi:MAG TPA: DUF58 domain-containing protein [Acidimicrobiales bacterium]
MSPSPAAAASGPAVPTVVPTSTVAASAGPGGPARPDGPAPEHVLRRLELTVNRRLDGLLLGDHRGLVPGHGTETGDTRLYAPGDDVRRIDWNVTARAGDPHVRLTIAERELCTWLVVDLSASLDFGTAACTKRDLAVNVSAAAAVLAARSGNRLGAVLLTGDGLVTVPARSGRPHARSVLHRLVTAPRADGRSPADLADAVRPLAHPNLRRGLVVVVSDFLVGAGWDRAFGMLTQRHDVLAVEVLDPRELDLPDVGVLVVADPETGRQREVRTSDAAFRERYSAAARAHRAEIAATLRRVGAEHLVLSTDRDWLVDLARFLTHPIRRARRSRS